ncbi:GNAT family N-acetyltransferase [Kitasatospora sp. NPDC087861]|uniref:GNAT family N-acetyltransferase n=1 Tax=Kitasatospora sp. NPDC087861 TaxID=3364070 RepID=UPI0037FD74CD
MIITQARPSDLALLLAFRRETAQWLAGQGIDQWSNPFPEEVLLASIEAGTVFVVHDHGTPAATVTLDNNPEPNLWTPEELAEPCMHLHKLTVARAYAGQGLGGRLLDWAGDRTARAGGQWVRINAWTTNVQLHRFWLNHGYHHVRTVSGGGIGNQGVSGWLAQREALRTVHGLDDRTAG